MSSSSRIQLYLLVASFMMVIAGFFVLSSHWGGAPPGSTYTPAHIQDGKLVPGETKSREIKK